MHTGRNWVVFSVSLDPPEIAFVWFLLATTGWPGEEFHSPDPGLLRTVPRLSQRGEGLSSRHKGRQTYANPSGEFQQAALKTTTRENKKTRKAKTTMTLPKKKKTPQQNKSIPGNRREAEEADGDRSRSPGPASLPKQLRVLGPRTSSQHTFPQDSNGRPGFVPLLTPKRAASLGALRGSSLCLGGRRRKRRQLWTAYA